MSRPPPQRTLVAVTRPVRKGGRNEHRTTEGSLHELSPVARAQRQHTYGRCRDAGRCLAVPGLGSPTTCGGGQRSPAARHDAVSLERSNALANLGHEGSGLRRAESKVNALANLGHEGSGLMATWQAATLRPWRRSRRPTNIRSADAIRVTDGHGDAPAFAHRRRAVPQTTPAWLTPVTRAYTSSVVSRIVE